VEDHLGDVEGLWASIADSHHLMRIRIRIAMMRIRNTAFMAIKSDVHSKKSNPRSEGKSLKGKKERTGNKVGVKQQDYAAERTKKTEKVNNILREVCSASESRTFAASKSRFFITKKL
jgi:hypothetical protein